ncbi:aminotransferase class V-fold PLP-dependent enzyme [Cohnella herbarum]|uniref:Aminotransferase class V-fold PLP-dependent enzyme n=1 Tax=Cohnella herbarum TaxID=2728023 RepID=A0A7Z2ZKF0_9BACL|nr:aminotransferase class V-fold PLP-dependent enzyme [Cohnella herbarum]QJD83121.1 aminotransferase class V-fold PLP-dependent enzyme [Cohnella herbarum]
MNKQDFIGLDQSAWLFCGAEAPVHSKVMDAVMEYMIARTRGPRGRERNAKTEWACKTNLASLIGGRASDIALMSNSSEAISMAAQAVRLQAGDNVIINNLEFPSGVLPWLALRRQGVEVRIARHNEWGMETNDIMELVDDRTRLVMTSHVSYLSGTRIDYKKLYEQLRDTNALMLLDATQSLGVVPVDIRHTDMLVCSSYKWLLSTHGAGILALNPGRVETLIPTYVGWRSVVGAPGEDRFASYAMHTDARRFELGYPSYPTIYALECATRLLLETGIDNIERHVLELGGQLIELLKEQGLQVMTPDDPARRAGNISFAHADAEAIAGKLAVHDVYVMGGDERVRASIHAYTDSTDIGRLITLLPSVLDSRA